MNKLSRGALCGAVTLVVAGCDLAPEAEQIPTTMEIAPNDTMLLVDDQIKLRIAVRDQNGEEMAGPPSWATAKWFVDGRKDAITISPQGDVVAKKGASLGLTAFLAGMEPAKARLRINPSSVKLSVAKYYFNQVTQNAEGTVPVLANRQALLRVFPTGDETSYFRPNVRADFYRDGQMVHTVLMPPAGDELLTEVVEGNLVNSYNAVIPGSVFQEGTELVIEVDPEGVIPRKQGSQTRMPATGRQPLDILTPEQMQLVLVPTVLNQRPDAVVPASWSSGVNLDVEHIRNLRNLLPIADMTVEAHATLYTDANLTNRTGWAEFVGQIWAIWQTEGRNAYYYGVVKVPPGSPLGGRAYVIGHPPVSVGADDTWTFAHEVGHTMSLYHSGCNVNRDDPNYPYPDGSIGTWGYNFARGDLVNPDYDDVMGYCPENYWVNGYQFGRALRYRDRRHGPAEPPPPERTLLLWGSASREEVSLQPAFLIRSPPTEPSTSGPYRLEGTGPSGEVRFGFDFTPVPVEHGGAHFLFTLPYDPDRDGVIERIVLSGPGGEDVLTPGSTPPMAIIRDGPDGPIRAFLRDWDGTVPAGLARENLFPQIMLSDGIPGGVR